VLLSPRVGLMKRMRLHRTPQSGAPRGEAACGSSREGRGRAARRAAAVAGRPQRGASAHGEPARAGVRRGAGRRAPSKKLDTRKAKWRHRSKRGSGNEQTLKTTRRNSTKNDGERRCKNATSQMKSMHANVYTRCSQISFSTHVAARFRSLIPFQSQEYREVIETLNALSHAKSSMVHHT